MMDSATRYKQCTLIADRTAQSIMEGFMDRWISIFGPPSVCISDQEAAVTGDDVSINFERLCILRNPKGSDPQGKHTGTGGIERHVQLTKMTMLKLREELESQGVTLPIKMIGQEAAMAQNLTLEYGGVTLAQAALGMYERNFRHGRCGNFRGHVRAELTRSYGTYIMY